MYERSQEERVFAAAIYGISYFTAFIGPIVIWLLKKDESEFIDYHGRQYFNFLISYFIYFAIAGILVLILVGVLLLWILGILQIIFTIIAAVRAFEGKEYSIPFIIKIF